MFEFLKRSPTEPRNPTLEASMSTKLNSTQQVGGVQEEVIGVVLKDLLRMHGVPANWLTFEINYLARGPGLAEVQIQLLIMRWSEQLLRYAAALQDQLLTGLDQFEPHVDHSHYVVVWRFSKDCDLPFSTIPVNVKWHVSTPAGK
jgi:hypothetical protein